MTRGINPASIELIYSCSHVAVVVAVVTGMDDTSCNVGKIKEPLQARTCGDDNARSKPNDKAMTEL